MGDSTGISWTDATWNPVRGCSRVSAGCVHCYAEVQAARIVRMGKGKPTAYDGLVSVRSKVSGLRYKDVGAAGDFDEPRWTGEVRLVPEQLAWPLRKRKPLRVFVNSMSDLFHEKLSNEQIAAVFGVMAACPQHTFQVLTKRARRMREWFEWLDKSITRHWHMRWGVLWEHLTPYLGEDAANAAWNNAIANEPQVTSATPIGDVGCHAWPLPNVWLGVSVEDQAAADERIPELLRTPAAVRFLSCEPLLGEVKLRNIDAEKAGHDDVWFVDALTGKHDDMGRPCAQLARIDWIIAGCESGPGARPCSVDWLRSLRDQCADAGVAYFLKQATFDCDVDGNGIHDGDGSTFKTRGARRSVSGRAGALLELPYLDGVQHAEFPS